MEPEVAQIIVVSITAIGAIAWMLALVMVVRVSRGGRQQPGLSEDRFEIEDRRTDSPGSITGAAEVDGAPAELSRKIAARLATDGNTAFGPVKILRCDPDQIVFEPSARCSRMFRRSLIRLTPDGSRTRVEYAIDASNRGLLVGAWLTLALGLAALIAAPTLEFLYIVPSPNPNVRVQSIQTVQMIHFLWPPFLFAFLAGHPRRVFRAQMESLVNNLPYC